MKRDYPLAGDVLCMILGAICVAIYYVFQLAALALFIHLIVQQPRADETAFFMMRSAARHQLEAHTWLMADFACR